MRRQLAAFVASGGAFIASSGTPMAHHSFAMFDQENPIELVGTVQEFKYTSPHSYLLLEVKGPGRQHDRLESGRPRAKPDGQGWVDE